MRKSIFVMVFILMASLLCAAEKAATKKASPTVPDKPAVGGSPIDPKTYVIGAEDSLLIRVWREPDISGPVIVRPDGKISLQLVNEIQAAGLTPEKLAGNIAEGLKKYITQPEVVVSVQQVNSRKYYLSGEISAPGAKPLTVPTTVLEALVSAGGLKDFAKPSKIRIMRGNRIFKFNYKEVIKGKHMEQNILLEPGDQIIVP